MDPLMDSEVTATQGRVANKEYWIYVLKLHRGEKNDKSKQRHDAGTATLHA